MYNVHVRIRTYCVFHTLALVLSLCILCVCVYSRVRVSKATVRAMIGVVKEFGWRAVNIIYVDTAYGQNWLTGVNVCI